MNQTQKGVTMFNNVAAFRRIAFMVVILALSALACNFQSDEPTEEAPPPTSTTAITRAIQGKDVADEPVLTPSATLSAPETLPANVTTESIAPTSTVAPTFTPIQAPTLAVTRTPTATPTRRPGATSTRVQSTSTSTGPLAFEYSVSWRFKDANATKAIATVTIMATGGGGDYRYYRDVEQEVEATFEYEWATCRPNPISFMVTSASGESVKEDISFNPPCPTSTPFS
jgi:hypothetical protein